MIKRLQIKLDQDLKPSVKYLHPSLKMLLPVSIDKELAVKFIQCLNDSPKYLQPSTPTLLW